MIYDVDLETLPREELEALQLKRLKSVCERVYANVPFYRRSFDELGVSPADIRSLKDVSKLPFTKKQDLRDNYPYGMFAVPAENVVRIHASSGTTGKATVVGYTQRDVDNWATLMARCFMCAGATRKDLVHNAYGYGLFTGGLGAHYGAERLGATTIPVSGGATKRQVQLLRDFGATVICSTPSYFLFLLETAEQEGIDFKSLPLRVGIFGAEPWSDEMRREIEERANIKATNVYGLSEVMGPGVSMECLEAQKGMHIFEDHFLPEIIDPETGETLPPGETGELVLTTLTKEAIPLIRYRTRDITSLDYTPCRCGRTHVRMSRIKGRSDDMLIIRGVNVFPSQIESILLETPGLSPHYQIIVNREGNLDVLEVQVEVQEEMHLDEIKRLQSLERNLQKTIKEFLGVTAKIKLVEHQTIERSQGKAKRVVDLRGK
ncbi:MAG: phenylacetate--CoA ligase [Desulfovibrionaceae bacterium]|jgi:phenylacetate-CoA ligase|nr:phenylacetate--CoA ligase [Desulfovibrionaceae bacterium]